jgi:hypothetical protein
MSDRGDNVNRPNKPDEPDDVYSVAPPDPEVVDYKPSVYPVVHQQPPEPEPQEDDRFQFTLAELLLFTAVASFFLSILGLLPGGYTAANFAGLTGAGVLLSLGVLAVLKPSRAIIRLGWWAMVVVYALACVVAIIRG